MSVPSGANHQQPLMTPMMPPMKGASHETGITSHSGVSVMPSPMPREQNKDAGPWR